MYIEFREPEPEGHRGVCLSGETRFHDCGFLRTGDLRKKIRDKRRGPAPLVKKRLRNQTGKIEE